MSPPVSLDLGYVPPDGGWGWAVVFGASISVGFAYTFPKAFTIYFKELQAVYSISYSQIAWITSIMCATTYGGGMWGKTMFFFGKEEIGTLGRGEYISLRKFLESCNCKFGFLFSDDVHWQNRENHYCWVFYWQHIWCHQFLLFHHKSYYVWGEAMVGLFESWTVISAYLVLSLVLFLLLAFCLKQKMCCLHSWYWILELWWTCM